MKKNLLGLLVLLSAVVGCGGVSRSFLVLEREDPGEMMESIHQAVLARGYEAQFREERQVSFFLDRALGTRVIFQAKRRGVLLVVRAAEGEEIPLAQTEQELARAEALGREIMNEANVVYGQLQQQRYAQEEAERLQDERDEQYARDNPPDNSQLEAFMAGNRARHDAFRANGQSESAAPPQSVRAGTTPAPQQAAGGRCCINGSYYECPNAGSVDQCVGRFTRCIAQCGGSCFEACLQSDPPDPSGCHRTPARDGEC